MSHDDRDQRIGEEEPSTGLPYISSDGVGDLITDADDMQEPAPSSGAEVLEEEQDINDFDNDADLEHAGSSPEFQHLRKRQPPHRS